MYITVDAITRDTSKATEKSNPLESVSRSLRRRNTAVSAFLKETPKLWARFRGKGRDVPSFAESSRNTTRNNVLNAFLIFIPFAWVSHYHWHNDNITFTLSFLGIVALESLLEFGGEQMNYFVGRELGGLIIITMDNAVEAALALILLKNCELRILQSTIVGVILLHLLLLPGTAFLTEGSRVLEQNLHPHSTQLNASLLTIGVMTILIPTAFFAALDNGPTEDTLVSDATRLTFLKMSHGLAIILLLVYITSRIFLHNPPGKRDGSTPATGAPPEILIEEARLLNDRPKASSGFCILLLIITIALLGITAEMLVKSIEHVREDGNIQEEWFGLILLPFVSFSADGVVAILYFIRATPEQPETLAKSRAIDLSVQFTLFWMPFLVLLGWWIRKPLILLFDLYEVVITLGAIFLVNYVTADSKTNLAEGFILVALYFMIALCTWFYPGQPTVAEMLTCGDVVGTL
ncbi:hypothetical protein SCHPADRAFT_832869 [Schizopora paradoxa]|uniref:Sodium/calcium exchanger membrane region domain-containing protein n=1 Tax=Schizopora paradoxa TaxID=27342 RepID=A0A0H2RL99_9AGAM|nr:hypothetical protein SCHPADRAFT_832869 [Schizopora paradoxa]